MLTIPEGLLTQGLLTNDVAALATPEAKPLYACILNAQGRVLHDMFLYRQGGVQQRWMYAVPHKAFICLQPTSCKFDVPAGSHTTLLADVDASSMPDLVKLLKR